MKYISMGTTSHLQHLLVTIGTSATSTNLFRRQSEKPLVNLHRVHRAEMCQLRKFRCSTCGQEFDDLLEECDLGRGKHPFHPLMHPKQYASNTVTHCRYDRHEGCPASAEQQARADRDRLKQRLQNERIKESRRELEGEHLAERHQRLLDNAKTTAEKQDLQAEYERQIVGRNNRIEAHKSRKEREKAATALERTTSSGQRRKRDEDEDRDDQDGGDDDGEHGEPPRKRQDNEDSPETQERKKTEKAIEDRRNRLRKDLWQ